MKILFKSDTQYFYLNKENTICYTHIKTYGGYDVPNDLKHINTLPIITHLYYNNVKHEVYYIHNGRIIIKASDVRHTFNMDNNGIAYNIMRDDFFLGPILNEYKLDYTEVNINKILNGNII